MGVLIQSKSLAPGRNANASFTGVGRLAPRQMNGPIQVGRVLLRQLVDHLVQFCRLLLDPCRTSLVLDIVERCLDLLLAGLQPPQAIERRLVIDAELLRGNRTFGEVVGSGADTCVTGGIAGR